MHATSTTPRNSSEQLEEFARCECQADLAPSCSLTSHAEWQESLNKAEQFGLIDADQLRVALLITDTPLNDMNDAADKVGVAAEQLQVTVDRLTEIGLMLNCDNPIWDLINIEQ